MLRRLLVVTTVLLGGLAAVPSFASPAPTTAATFTTLAGKAGSYAEVTLTGTATFSLTGSGFDRATADRGDFLGLALVSPKGDHWVVFTEGRVRQSACVFAAPCGRYDFAGVAGSDPDTSTGADVTLPRGHYRAALLGRPGANVTISTTLPGVSGTVVTRRPAVLTVTGLTSSYPATTQDQPLANGATSFAGNGPTVVGALFRLDTRVAHSADYSFCLSTGANLLPLACSGTSGSTSTAGDVYYESCPAQPVPGLVCLPLDASSDAFSLSYAAVVNSVADIGYDLETHAVNSRVSALAFALSF